MAELIHSAHAARCRLTTGRVGARIRLNKLHITLLSTKLHFVFGSTCFTKNTDINHIATHNNKKNKFSCKKLGFFFTSDVVKGNASRFSPSKFSMATFRAGKGRRAARRRPRPAAEDSERRGVARRGSRASRGWGRGPPGAASDRGSSHATVGGAPRSRQQRHQQEQGGDPRWQAQHSKHRQAGLSSHHQPCPEFCRPSRRPSPSDYQLDALLRGAAGRSNPARRGEVRDMKSSERRRLPAQGTRR